MLIFEEAKKIVEDYIGPDMAIYPDEIIEKPYGWFFKYQDKRYVETGNLIYLVFGIVGLIINKKTGKICKLGTGDAKSLEEQFKSYEAGLLNEFDPKKQIEKNKKLVEQRSKFPDSLGDRETLEGPEPEMTELIAAIYNHHRKPTLEFIARLLEGGANVGEKDDSGNTPLHWAANHGRDQVAKLLLQHGANVNATNHDGEAPVTVAYNSNPPFHWDLDVEDEGNYYSLQKLLLENGADVNSKDTEGLTPLNHVCASLNYLDVEAYSRVEFLLDKGADPNIPDDDGELPIDSILDWDLAIERYGYGAEYLEKNEKMLSEIKKIREKVIERLKP